jgi:hypothetical protein
MFRKLVQSAPIDVDGRSYVVHYFEHRTARGGRRFSAEIVLGADDRIILDDDSPTSLQAKVARLAPAMIYSRALAARGASVAA